MSTIYLSIGNSDDKLTQAEWSRFVLDVSAEVIGLASHIHGAWFSQPAAPWQNACWCVEFRGHTEQETANVVAEAKEMAAKLARKYQQESISWATADTEFVS